MLAAYRPYYSLCDDLKQSSYDFVALDDWAWPAAALAVAAVDDDADDAVDDVHDAYGVVVHVVAATVSMDLAFVASFLSMDFEEVAVMEAVALTYRSFRRQSTLPLYSLDR